MSETTDEHLVVSSLGMRMARTIFRTPPDQSFDKAVALRVDVRVLGPPTTTVRDVPIPRRTYITKKKVEDHGPTPGCARCADRGEHHTETCRKRFEEFERQEAAAAEQQRRALIPPVAVDDPAAPPRVEPDIAEASVPEAAVNSPMEQSPPSPAQPPGGGGVAAPMSGHPGLEPPDTAMPQAARERPSPDKGGDDKRNKIAGIRINGLNALVDDCTST